MNKICLSNVQQMVEALTCPVNRYATMVEHSCDEWELFKHPDWLMIHYIQNGGATAHAIKRNLARLVSLPPGPNETAVTVS